MKAFFCGVALISLVAFSLDASAASCVTQNLDGYLLLSSSSLGECSGFVVMDASEYSQVPTLQALFAWPDSDQMVQAWMAGFTLPMVCYLAAWGFGVVVNFFKPENERV